MASCTAVATGTTTATVTASANSTAENTRIWTLYLNGTKRTTASDKSQTVEFKLTSLTPGTTYSVKVTYGSTGTEYTAGSDSFTTHSAATSTTYRLNFNANGGTSGSTTYLTKSSTASYYDFTVPASATPTRSGYNFLGWAFTSTSTTVNCVAGGTIRVSDHNPETTLYAVWDGPYYEKLSATSWDYTVTNVTSTSFDVVISSITSSSTYRDFRGYINAYAGQVPEAWASNYKVTTSMRNNTTVTISFSGLNPDTIYYWFIQGKMRESVNCYCLPSSTTWGIQDTRTEYVDDTATINGTASYNSITVRLSGFSSRSYERTARAQIGSAVRYVTIPANSTATVYFDAFTGLESGTNYTVNVIIYVGNINNTTFSGSKIITTASYVSDSATILLSSSNSSSLTLNLTSIPSRPYVRTISVRCGSNSYSGTISANSTSATISLTGLASGTTYTVYVYFYAPDDTLTYSGSKVGYTRFGFNWSKTIAAGYPVTNLTATDWNAFTGYLKQKANRRSVTCPTFTTVSSNTVLTHTIFNQAADALYYDYSYYPVARVSAGSKVLASYFSNFVTYLNTDDN